MVSRTTRVRADTDDDAGADLLLGDLRRDAAFAFYLLQHKWQRVLIMSRDLSGAQSRVARVILQHASFKQFDRDGLFVAWPTQARIARLIGKHEDSVQLVVSQLMKEGVVTVRRKGRGYEYTFQLRWREKTEAALGPTLNEWPDGMLKNAAKSRRKGR